MKHCLPGAAKASDYFCPTAPFLRKFADPSARCDQSLAFAPFQPSERRKTLQQRFIPRCPSERSAAQRRCPTGAAEVPAGASFSSKPLRGSGPGDGSLGAAWAEGEGNRRREERRRRRKTFASHVLQWRGGGKGVPPRLALPTSPSGAPTGKK